VRMIVWARPHATAAHSPAVCGKAPRLPTGPHRKRLDLFLINYLTENIVGYHQMHANPTRMTRMLGKQELKFGCPSEMVRQTREVNMQHGEVKQ
jgi:hypothetical protein